MGKQVSQLLLISVVSLSLFTVSVTVWAEDLTQQPARRPVQVVRGEQGVVVAETAQAAEIGRDILAQGGNAVDAAVAVAFALVVTWPEAGNIAGGGFMMIAPPGRDVVCVEYRETAPAAVDALSFQGWKNRHHARMAGVPGTVAGLAEAHQRYGSLPWSVLVEPAAALAERGFVVNAALAHSINSVLSSRAVQEDARYAELRRVFQSPSGPLWRPGEMLFQPDLAGTLRSIAKNGPAAFYEGPIADLIVAEMERGEGLITAADLQEYRANLRPAITGQIGEYTVYGAPPPCSGGLTVLQHLRMLEHLRPKSDPQALWTVDQVHVITEVMRRGFRERAAHLGDPDFVSIPEHVGTAEHAVRMAGTIAPHQATPSAEIAGNIRLTAGPYESPDTTHFSVIDADGMGVSNTYTIEESWGARIVVRGGGFLLNNEMGDFNWYPGYTNHQGVIGTEANQIQPGKRMLSSQSPTIVKYQDRVVLLVGSPGGRTIINTVTLILAQTLLYERTLAEAVDGPRFHHQWFPDQISFEGDDGGLFREMTAELQRRGHITRQSAGRRQGSAHCIAVDPQTGVATGVADWRRDGAARAVLLQQAP